MRNDKELKLKLKTLTDKLKKLRKENIDLKHKNLHLNQARSVDARAIEELRSQVEVLTSQLIESESPKNSKVLLSLSMVFLALSLIIYKYL